VSLDGGETWAPASLRPPPTNAPGRAWAKALFEATLPLPEEKRVPGAEVELVVKATDETYNTQPEGAGPVWNARGLANNSFHRVRVRVTE
jgi:sulfite oxidase